MSFHKLIWDHYTPILREYEELGFCTSIYGDYEKVLKKYKPSMSMTVDVSEASLSQKGIYIPREYSVGVIIIMIIIGNICLVLSIITFILLFRRIICTDVADTSENSEVNVTNESDNTKGNSPLVEMEEKIQ